MSEAGEDAAVGPPTATEESETTGNTADEVPIEQPEPLILKGLLILPPRQRIKPTGAVPALILPPIRADEPVQSVKGALSEVVGLAHITNYRLELVESDHGPSNTNTVPWTAAEQLVSRYTGNDAVIDMPASAKMLEDEDRLSSKTKVLDEYADISSAGPLGDGSAFGMVLQRYDGATVLEHVARLRSMLQGNIPSIVDLVDDGELENASEQQKDDETATAADQPKAKKALPVLADYLPIDSDNLGDYFYLASGEDRRLYHGKAEAAVKLSKKKKKGKNGSGADVPEISDEQDLREKFPLWNQLDEQCWVNCQIRHSGFHPPPASRKLIGDLAYFELAMPNAPVLHITATVSGFYLNRSTTENGMQCFDPSPAFNACYSHALLDCLLQASTPFSDAWKNALAASKERAELIREMNTSSPHLSLFRLAVRGDFAGFSSAAAAAATVQTFDATIHAPSWLVPNASLESGSDTPDWSRNYLQSYQLSKAEDALMGTFGIDVRSGGSRDWNEEFCLAREMPISTQLERIERARLLFKVMTEFGEASLLGVKAIADNQIISMNPNESMRTQFYLHNNIFFSRAVDGGADTFKLHRGDKAARKQANRDIQCLQSLYRLDNIGVSTLATVLVDYLGVRYVCQSVLPGILIGDRSHKLIIGAVDSLGPLKNDEDVQISLEDNISEVLMVASRPVFRQPLTDDRLAEIQEAKKYLPALPPHMPFPTPEMETVEANATMTTCLPLEAKCIMGSDQRRYLLEIGRFTPRDANWLPQRLGGTGKYESDEKENGKSFGVPISLDDEEWALCVLRPELMHRFSESLLSKYLAEKQSEKLEQKKRSLAEKPDEVKLVKSESENGESSRSNDQLATEKETGISDDDAAFVKSLRFNVNVLLSGIRSFEGVDEQTAKLLKKDEERVRAAAIFLWDEVLPKINEAATEGTVQIPFDGRTLTEFLHRHGVNCRYLGRLAVLSQAQEELDAKVTEDLKHGRHSVISRRTLPKCWLELLECEMVARAAKHVLDSYLTERGGVAAIQPAQTVASFLCALISEAEETAAQTETRLGRRSVEEPDDEDFASLALTEVGGGGDAMPLAVRNRAQVWKDIEAEVARRFRYSLTLYNSGNKSGRARHTALLRRICQRAGVRLATKNYDLGAKCLCSAGDTHGGRLTRSYPITPLDIIDIVPLMKHTAAFNEGFLPCSMSPLIIPPLQISLQDARAALERAHEKFNARLLSKGLELAQEACLLFQQVTESSNHPGVADAAELMATIFHEAGDLPLAISHGEKALSLAIQTNGFDNANVVTLYLNLAQVLYSARNLDQAIKYMRAGIYLLGILAGENHVECYNAYHKLGNIYSQADYNGQYAPAALECYEETSKRDSSDRFNDGLTAKNFAKAYADVGNFKEAVNWEKKACKYLSLFLGKDHTWTKESEAALLSYTKSAVDRGSRFIHAVKLEEEEAKAAAMAAVLLAAEDVVLASKKTNKKKKSKK